MSEKLSPVEDVILKFRPNVSEIKHLSADKLTSKILNELLSYVIEIGKAADIDIPSINEKSFKRPVFLRNMLLAKLQEAEKILLNLLRPRYLDQLKEGKLSLTLEREKQIKAYLLLLVDFSKYHEMDFANLGLLLKNEDGQKKLSNIISQIESKVFTELLQENVEAHRNNLFFSPNILLSHDPSHRSVIDVIRLFDLSEIENPTFAQVKKVYFRLLKQLHTDYHSSIFDENLIDESRSAAAIINSIWSEINTPDDFSAFMADRKAQLNEITVELELIKRQVASFVHFASNGRIVKGTNEEIPDYYGFIGVKIADNLSSSQLLDRADKTRSKLALFLSHPVLERELFCDLFDALIFTRNLITVFSNSTKKSEYDSKYTKSSNKMAESKDFSQNNVAVDSKPVESSEFKHIKDNIQNWSLKSAKVLSEKISQLKIASERTAARKLLAQRFKNNFSFEISTLGNRLERYTELNIQISNCEYLESEQRITLHKALNEGVVSFFSKKLNEIYENNTGCFDVFSSLYQQHLAWTNHYQTGYLTRSYELFVKKFEQIVKKNIENVRNSIDVLLNVSDFYLKNRSFLDASDMIVSRRKIRDAFAEKAVKSFNFEIRSIRTMKDFERVEALLAKARNTFFIGKDSEHGVLLRKLKEARPRL